MAGETLGAVWRVLSREGTTYRSSLKRWERLGHVFFEARFEDWWDHGVGETEREAVERVAGTPRRARRTAATETWAAPARSSPRT